jgi:hypothetical protein
VFPALLFLAHLLAPPDPELPAAWEMQRFPPPEVAKGRLAFTREHFRYVDGVYSRLPWGIDAKWREYRERLEKTWTAYELLVKAHDGGPRARGRLRDFLGEEAWFGGTMPAWYDAEFFIELPRYEEDAKLRALWCQGGRRP